MNDKHDEQGRFAEKDYETKLKETMGMTTHVPYPKTSPHKGGIRVDNGLLVGQVFDNDAELKQELKKLEGEIEQILDIYNNNEFKYAEGEQKLSLNDFLNWPSSEQKAWLEKVRSINAKPDLIDSYNSLDDNKKKELINDFRAWRLPGIGDKFSDDEVWEMLLENKKKGGK